MVKINVDIVDDDDKFVIIKQNIWQSNMLK